MNGNSIDELHQQGSHFFSKAIKNYTLPTIIFANSLIFKILFFNRIPLTPNWLEI